MLIQLLNHANIFNFVHRICTQHKHIHTSAHFYQLHKLFISSLYNVKNLQTKIFMEFFNAERWIWNNNGRKCMRASGLFYTVILHHFGNNSCNRADILRDMSQNCRRIHMHLCIFNHQLCFCIYVWTNVIFFVKMWM
jgi:hypothetical protein